MLVRRREALAEEARQLGDIVPGTVAVRDWLYAIRVNDERRGGSARRPASETAIRRGRGDPVSRATPASGRRWVEHVERAPPAMKAATPASSHRNTRAGQATPLLPHCCLALSVIPDSPVAPGMPSAAPHGSKAPAGKSGKPRGSVSRASGRDRFRGTRVGCAGICAAWRSLGRCLPSTSSLAGSGKAMLRRPISGEADPRGHDQHGHAALGRGHRHQHLCRSVRSSRAVGSSNLRMICGSGRGRARDRRPLLLPARELARMVLCAGGEARSPSELPWRWASALGLALVSWTDAQRLGDIAERRRVRPQVELLEHHHVRSGPRTRDRGGRQPDPPARAPGARNGSPLISISPSVASSRKAMQRRVCSCPSPRGRSEGG